MQLEQDVEPKPERPKQARETDSVFQLIGRQKLVAAWESRAEAERLAAISKWKLMVLQNPGASSLGRQLLALNEQPQLAAQVVDDTFESKENKNNLFESWVDSFVHAVANGIDVAGQESAASQRGNPCQG